MWLEANLCPNAVLLGCVAVLFRVTVRIPFGSPCPKIYDSCQVLNWSMKIHRLWIALYSNFFMHKSVTNHFLVSEVQFGCTLHLLFLHIVTEGGLCTHSNECSKGGELLATGRSYFVRQAVKLVGNCMAGGQHGGCFRWVSNPGWACITCLSYLVPFLLTY